MSRRVIVVGGGVGGMAAALRLAARGHEVVLVERRARLGGKLDVRERDGFRFDVGPSLLTLPEVFDDLLAAAGRRLAEEVDLIRLDPICAYSYADGSGFEQRADEASTLAAVEAMRAGNGAELAAFLHRARRVWAVARRTFLAGPLDAALLRSGGAWRDLLGVDPLPTLAARARRSFTDPRLRWWAGRYATYSGSSPYLAPATLACIAAVEQDGGAWYVSGGLDRLRAALERALRHAGVTVRTEAEVAAVEVGDGGVAAVRLADGERISAAAVVAAVDAEELYGRLLPRPEQRRRLCRAGRSSSGFVLLLGLRGTTPGLGHHTVLVGSDPREEFDAIHRRRVAAPEPTVYVSRSVASDPAAAPPGDEALYALVNVPGADAVDWDATAPAYGDRLLELLARRGLEVRDRLRFRETITPRDLEHRYRTPGGAIYGTSSNGRRAAFLRPANRGPVAGLFLAGGSSHPGGGLPLVALSGGFAASLADAHLRAAGRR